MFNYIDFIGKIYDRTSLHFNDYLGSILIFEKCEWIFHSISLLFYRK